MPRLPPWPRSPPRPRTKSRESDSPRRSSFRQSCRVAALLTLPKDRLAARQRGVRPQVLHKLSQPCIQGHPWPIVIAARFAPSATYYDGGLKLWGFSPSSAGPSAPNHADILSREGTILGTISGTRIGWIRRDGRAQLPPTLRGVRGRGTKPREVVALQGWCVWGFGARVGVDVAASGDRATASAAALARAAPACASSFSRQQCLYLRPEPQ